MKEYKYICCEDIEEYKGWDIVKIIDGCSGQNDMVVISRENKPVQDFIKLNEAASKQILEELSKRLLESR